MHQNNLESIYNMGLVLFRQIVVLDDCIRYQLGGTLLEMVVKERRKEEVIDRRVVENSCKMLVALGIEGEHQRLLYQDIFEDNFLERSARFFASESQKLLKQNSVDFYIRKVEARMDLEAMRTSQYLDKTTLPKLVQVMEEELIQQHMETIVNMKGSGVEFMLRNERTDDLARLFKLFRRVGEEGHKVIGDCISRFLRQNSKSTVEAPDANSFAKNLIELKDKFDRILEVSFHNDTTMKRVISDSFEHLLNLNSRSPEFLAMFIDNELRKEAKGVAEEEVNTVLDKALSIFRFLQEKDVFEEHFRQHQLARLLGQYSVLDTERMLISKLKAECGGQFTTNLEDMLKDIELSATLNKEFHKELCKTSENLLCISVKVLKQSSWPGKASPPVTLPPEPAEAFAAFENFYLSKWKVERKAQVGEKECSRKLILEASGGSAELRAVFFNQGKRREHVLCVSTYQMIILLKFNTGETVSFKELAMGTNIPDKELKRALQPLFSKSSQQILKKSPDNRQIESKDVFSINELFNSTAHRVKIQQGSFKGGESSGEQKDIMEKIEVDRKGELEAYIVRIMKMRKQLQHNQLVAELVEQVKKRFQPSPMAIKTRIEALIDKEYIKRSDHDNSCYIYLA